MKEKTKKIGRLILPALPQEILVQVFHKLPLKFLIQCNLVCKQWRTLISDPFFKTNYNPNSIPNHPVTLLLIQHTWNDAVIRNPPLMHMYEINNPEKGHPISLQGNVTEECFFRVLGSWNGLVALYYKQRFRRRGELCLFNPITKGQKLVSLADDNVDGLNAFGPCHDPTSDEYKAVLCQLTSFYVVSFKHGKCKFKTQPEMSTDLFIYRPRSMTILEGVPHWVSCCRFTLEEFISYFDPIKEEFTKIGLPKGWPRNRTYGLGALNGKLTVTYKKAGSLGFDVWVLKKYGNENSWSLQFVMADYTCPVDLKAENWAIVSPLTWMTDEEVLIDVNYQWRMIYNVTNRRLQPLGKMKDPCSLMLTYIPSLVSPTEDE